MLKRGVKSPDRGDAAVQSFYELASVPAASTVLAQQHRADIGLAHVRPAQHANVSKEGGGKWNRI
jgi:hypothetical protein